MTQHAGQPHGPGGSGEGDTTDPYASPSSGRYGSLPPPGPATPPSSGSGTQPWVQQGEQPYAQPYGQPPYGQAPYGGWQPMGPPPANSLVWAILSTVLCCWPLGIASIVFAAQVNSKWSAGDLAGARDSSEKAKKFAIWSALGGVIIVLLCMVPLAVVGFRSDL